MASRVPDAFVVRPTRTWLLAGTAVLALLIVGCGHHRRSSLRPVYVAPPAQVVVPATPCPAGEVCPPSVSAPAPAFTDELPPASPSLEPAPAPRGVSEEPRLEPSSTVSPPPSSAPELSPPATTTIPRETYRSAPAPSTRRATLRSRLTGFVNDPTDLFQPPKADRNWRYIVLHHSAAGEGSYAEIDREHRARLGTDGCGYHFVIGNGTGSPDGQIEVAKRWSEQKAGAHCRDAVSSEMVDYGIGICLIGNFDGDPPTPRQIEATQALVAYLRERYNITASHVGPHVQYARTPTVCPGKHFPTQLVLGSNQPLH